MRKLPFVAVITFAGLLPTPALADHDEYPRCDSRNGGCSEREEQYGDNSCKYVCPDFKDSPVHDAFNFSPTICLPGSTCHFDGQKEGEQGGGSSGTPR